MSYKLVATGGGGIFSLFMDIIIPRIYELEADSFNIEVHENQYSPPVNCFDFVFEQPDTQEPIQECTFAKHRAGFRKKGMGMGAIEDYKDFDLIKECCKKFIIRKDITDRLMDIPQGTLGIHFRGGDMDSKHPQFGVFKYEDYKRKIEKINPNNIFIASDNDEVIENIKSDFDIPVYYYNFIRAKTIDDDTYKVQMDNASDPIFWQEAFIEMLTLSRCESLLCRISCLANASIAFSDTLKNIHRL